MVSFVISISKVSWSVGITIGFSVAGAWLIACVMSVPCLLKSLVLRLFFLSIKWFGSNNLMQVVSKPLLSQIMTGALGFRFWNSPSSLLLLNPYFQTLNTHSVWDWFSLAWSFFRQVVISCGHKYWECRQFYGWLLLHTVPVKWVMRCRSHMLHQNIFLPTHVS